MTTNPPASFDVQLPHGRQLRYSQNDALCVADPQGVVELEIRITSEGPVVKVGARSLTFKASESVQVECQRFRVAARDSIELESNGDMRSSIAGDVDTRVGGHLELDARDARLRGRRGGVDIEASDDVRIDGERVQLNS